MRAYAEAPDLGYRPVCIIAKTKKGAGVSFLADHEGWHGKALPPADAEKALAELGNPDVRYACHPAADARGARSGQSRERAERLFRPAYELGAKVATREAYGDALVALGHARPNVIVLDGEVSNSTFSDKFKKFVSGAVYRGLYRGAATGQRSGRPAGAAQDAVLLHLCRLLRPRLRSDPHGGDLDSQHRNL